MNVRAGLFLRVFDDRVADLGTTAEANTKNAYWCYQRRTRRASLFPPGLKQDDRTV